MSNACCGTWKKNRRPRGGGSGSGEKAMTNTAFSSMMWADTYWIVGGDRKLRSMANDITDELMDLEMESQLAVECGKVYKG